MTIKAFSPNGEVTYETCAVCQEPKIKIEHGREVKQINGKWENTGSYQHNETCSECGESMPIVLYDCKHCAV